MRFSVSRRRTPNATALMLIGFLAIIIYTFWIVESHLKPTLMAIAESKTASIATQVINNVISEKIVHSVDPQTLLTVKVDNQGRVVFIQPNTAEFSKLATNTTIKVQEALDNMNQEKIEIPMGQVFGSQLLASLGPKITVNVIPVGNVQSNILDKFEQAGINQTRHTIYLASTAQIRIVVPLVSKVVNVSAQVPVTEYVVVGEVPSTYVQFPFPLASEQPENSK